MDDCPISFGARAQLPLNPALASGAWETNPPGIAVELTFDTAMNTTVTPADASWELRLDGSGLDTQNPSWLNSFVLRLGTVSTPDPTSTLTIQLLVEDPNLHSLSGMRPVLPFPGTDIFFAI